MTYDSRPALTGAPLAGDSPAASAGLPAYLQDTYRWAYLDRRNQRLLDRPLVVNAILWGNYRRLVDWALAELPEGASALLPACVYGDFCQQLADRVGPRGRLVVADVADNQLEGAAPKLSGRPWAELRQADAALPPAGRFDRVICFFLLHEVPDEVKGRIVQSLLSSLTPGGRAVFVDYHRPQPLHPLRPVMSLVFDGLEPFAKGLWRQEIQTLAGSAGADLRWRKETLFGGLYQKVVAQKA